MTSPRTLQNVSGNTQGGSSGSGSSGGGNGGSCSGCGSRNSGKNGGARRGNNDDERDEQPKKNWADYDSEGEDVEDSPPEVDLSVEIEESPNQTKEGHLKVPLFYQCLESIKNHTRWVNAKRVTKTMEATVDTALDGMTKVYCTLIEENRRLSMKLLEAKEKQPLAAAPKTYLEAVASHIQRYPLSVQTKKPPAQLHQKRVTVRIDDLPESKQERETKLTQCRDKVVDRIGQDKLKVNKVRIREGDLVISVNESESPEEVRRSIGEIHGVSARVSRSLDPEVVVFTKALPMRVAEEELISQIKSYHPSLDTTAWHVVRAHRSFVILRMSLADRNKCMGPMKGSVFVRGCRLPVRDYVGVSVCYDCGQVHAPNRKGEPVKRCRKKEDGSYSLQCIHCGQHGHCRNSCPKKDQNIEVNALKCTLCDKTGHSAHRGDLCPQKIAALKARLRKTDYGEGEAFVPFNWAFNLGEIGIDQ